MRMSINLEKILSHWTLLAINVVIITVTELSSHFFVDKGIIHLIALLFVFLGISRIFVHYDAYDRYLRPLIRGGLAALLFFSVSHLVEFLGYVYLKTYEDAIFINVINFYIISILAITIGAEYFLRTLKEDNRATIWILSAGVVVFLVLTPLIFLNKIKVSLELDSWTVYVYTVIVLGALFFGVDRLVKIKRHVPVVADFVNYFIATFVLVAISAFQYIFYDAIGAIGVPAFQVVYMSHFLFYGALSFMFLAFARLAHMGGVYESMSAKEPLK